LNYQEDDSMEVEAWQIEDYRLLTDEDLFSRLREVNIFLDHDTFHKYIQNCEDPEDLTALLAENLADVIEKDKIYLPVFELWRRFANDRQSLSIFCDEFDRRVELYDIGSIDPHFSLEDSIYHLQRFFEENKHSTPSPQALFHYISDRMANDLESFLYEYISDQIEMQNSNYAFDLIEGFEPFITMPKWFHLLRAKLSFYFGMQEIEEVLALLIIDLRSLDLEFGFEMMDFCRLIERQDLCIPVAKQIIKALELEKDFQELLVELLHFFQERNSEVVTKIQHMLDKRDFSMHQEIQKDDPDVHEIWQILIKES